MRSEATLALPMGELAAPLGQTERVPRSTTRFQSSNGVPSQSACSADSSPIGRAKVASLHANDTAKFQFAAPLSKNDENKTKKETNNHG